MNVVSKIMDYEMGELDFEETVALFQELVDTGMLAGLQGSYQRTAAALASDGWITL